MSQKRAPDVCVTTAPGWGSNGVGEVRLRKYSADSGENEVRRRNMRECEDAMMEDTASRRGYAPTAAWDEGNMIQAMARMKNPTIAWRFGDG